MQGRPPPRHNIRLKANHYMISKVRKIHTYYRCGKVNHTLKSTAGCKKHSLAVLVRRMPDKALCLSQDCLLYLISNLQVNPTAVTIFLFS